MSLPPPLRRSILTRTLVALAAGFSLLLPQSPASAAPEPTKIDKAVLADLKDGEATFMVRLNGEADLRAARAATTKAAKGKAVYDAKTAYAKRTQARLRKLLADRKAENTPFWIVNRVQVTADTKLAAEIAALPEVASLNPVGRAELPKPIPGKAEAKAKANAVEWNIDRINAPRVWNEDNNRGEGIVVGIIDSGADFEHPEIVESYRGLRPDGYVDHNYNWATFLEGCFSPAPCDSDEVSHGTHVTGTIAGKNGIGVAPGVKWIAARACDGSHCDESALWAAGEWMVAPTDLNGQNPRTDLSPDIVNSSWTIGTNDPAFESLISTWVTAGIFPMFANGNAGPNCGTSQSPGEYVKSYSVGAFGADGTAPGSSSRGAGENGEIKPNISAPGVDIRSSITKGRYAVWSGTSMASPQVAGAVALIWSAAPSLRRNVSATRALLDGTAIDTPDTTCGGTAADNNVYGEGRLDAYAAVQAAPDDPLGTLNGTITANGRPLSGADVTVTGPVGRTGGTGQDGTYSLLRVPPGSYQVTVSKFGYSPVTTTATVVDGQSSTADATLTRRPDAVVTGTITTAGVPEQGATVVAFSTRPVKAVTDSSGRYELTLPHDTYRLEITSASRCVAPVTQQITVTGNTTRNATLTNRHDDFGYTCAIGSEPYVAGTNRLALEGTVETVRVTAPFPVPFYGKAYSDIWVTPGGFASFGKTAVDADNTPLPSPFNVLAVFPYWEDLVVEPAGGVYTATVGTAPHRSFVIEWRNVRNNRSLTARVSFSVLLGENGTISYRYKDIDDSPLERGASATIGIENADGTDALQYSHNTLSIKNGQSLTFTAADYGVVRGTVTDANDHQPITNATVEFPDVATFTTGADGTFTGQIRAGSHNAKVYAPNYGTTYRNVTVTHGAITAMDVELVTGKITAAPGELDLIAPPGGTTTATVTLTNHGVPTSFEATSDSAWLTVTPAEGGLVKNQAATLTVTATGGETERTGKITIRSTSGRKPVIEIPVTITP
ncbi:S8 family serine peptidase [Nonomuraea sp. NPDC049725]|uniref:S8 family serine peptidase n=1 Tax=Nonomuraea sp. NPDC049725 TaxID=3154508 RepID=UPI00343617F8